MPRVPFWRRSKQLVLATFQSVTKKRLKGLLNVAGTAYWNVAGTLILAILHVGGGHLGQPFGPARRSGDPSLARKRSPAHLFGYVASAVALAARRRARVPHSQDGLRGSPRQRSRDAHRGVGQHWRHVPSAAALPTIGRRAPPPPPPARVCTARAAPTPEPPPSPPNSTQTQTQTPTPPQAGTQERPQTTPPKKEEAPGGVLQRGVVQRLLNGLLLGVHHRVLGVRRAPAPPPGQGAHQTPSQGSQESRAPPTQGQAKGKMGGGCKYKAGEQVYVVFRDNGQWGIEQGKEALAAGGPPGVGETWISFPKDPELFAIPRASVWKTKTQAKKFLAKMMAAEEEDKEDDADADEEGDESNDGDGDGGDEGDGPGAGLGATGANRDGGVGEEVEGVEGERMEVEGVEGEGGVGEGVEGEGVEGEGVVGEGVEGEGVVGEGVVVGEGDGGGSGAGDKSSGAPAGPPTTQDF